MLRRAQQAIAASRLRRSTAQPVARIARKQRKPLNPVRFAAAARDATQRPVGSRHGALVASVQQLMLGIVSAHCPMLPSTHARVIKALM
jgi:hypothetical protein